MEVVSAIVGPVVNVLTNHITQKLRNLTSSADRVKKMKDKMKVLDGQRVDNEKQMRANSGNNKEIPDRVPGWLEDVKKIKEEVDKVSSNDIGCFNVKKKYLAGRNALRLTDDIDRLIEESKGIIWRDNQIPLGRVDSKRPASTSTSTSGGNTQIMFKSRDKIFDDALKFLQHDDDKTRVIALCGMGGVGKTTLMKQLKEAAEDNKMFKWIVVVAVGKSSNLLEIQNVIAAHTGESLTETNEKLRATRLSKRFQAFSERNEKSLVILDDVWEKIKLEDIGLKGPLPNGVKLLLTSREENICQQIAADAGSVLQPVRVGVLEEEEARDFFCQIAEISAEDDRDLYKKGCKIVKKCGYLPLAISLIAATLRCKSENVWKRTLKCLKKNKEVLEFVDISYKNLEREEDKAIFLLCGMFPEDSNIPIEDLTRYAWGLTLLKQVYTIEDARECTQTSVSNLKNAFLLMDGDSDDYECVKMHDLVLAFVVNTVSKGGEDGCWIIHHEDFSKWSEADNMSQSCKQLSLTSKGMSKFPSEFQFPNLSLLKLMHGDELLRPQDFYVGMEKLQVIAIEKLEYPPVPGSFQSSTNLRTLRTLCLHECSLMFDLNCIGNLSNLEVLSFANSGITILPSTFRNLKELRLLDVTGCYNLAIDDGVLGSLVKLEELYMIPYDEKACCFTENNNSELAERSKNLCALEFEFIGNNAHKKNVSCEKLKRFKLSLGCSFTEVRNALGTRQVDTHSYENSLKLVTNKEELLKSKINELFKKTNALYLQVNDINTLEDVDVEFPRPLHPSRNCSFYKLRILVVSECAELKYLFTLSVATSLSKLEYLEISRCPNMEAVIHTENNRSDIIIFSNLKYLRLAELPNLLCFCNKFQLPRLVELRLEGLQNFTSIYPSNASSSSNISHVQSFFHKEDATPILEELVVSDMENLKEIWPPQFNSSNLRMLRELMVRRCAELKYLFTPSVATNLSKLEHLEISRCPVMEGVIHTENNGSSMIKFSNLKYLWLNNLPKLLHFCNKVDVVIELPRLMELKLEGLQNFTSIYPSNTSSYVSSNISHMQSFFHEEDATPMLENLFVSDMEDLKEIWPPQFSSSKLCLSRELRVKGCHSIEVLFNMDFGEIEQLSSSSLRSIEVEECDCLAKLFSCNPFPFFNNLQYLKVERCGSIQVLFNTDLGRAGKSEEQVCSSSLRSIVVEECDSLVNLLPSNPMPLFNNLDGFEF